ncbi:replication initiator protein RepSA [Streptomyces boninensis]|uniref:replication initiator protein RepSA n=1 Tax=Streptomyces boninensis TaxID=2039455 RepID=UPI003B21D2EC
MNALMTAGELGGLAPATLQDILWTARDPKFDRWREQIEHTGGCTDPIHLQGWTVTKDKTTGKILHEYTTEHEPGGRLRIACGNRRASRCAPCAWLYAGDTYHLIRAGLSGDPAKGVTEAVRDHPRVFLTLTAPSFGAVHNQPDHDRCACGTRHSADAARLGTPLDPETYDYAGAVLFNNHAGQLWHRFANRLRREIAARAHLSQRALADQLRLSYGKVAEFQRRGAVHFHAVIRLDGPDGPDSPPPAWATTELLTDAIVAALAHEYSAVTIPSMAGEPERVLRWGRVHDVRPIRAFEGGTAITEGAIAAYVAKYATKAAETTGTVDRPIGNLEALDLLALPDHPRRLIESCHRLDSLYPERRLWAWAHMLGFRGHFSTKSRRYSTTLTELRQARVDHRAAEHRDALGLDELEPDTVLVLAHWTYAGHGHTPGESALAAGIARDLQLNRETAREALQEQQRQEGALT